LRKSLVRRAARLDNQRMRVVFLRRPKGECVARIVRPDRVVVLLSSYSRKGRVPHDLAHAVTERELGLGQGVFGSIAAGALFKSMKVVSGRLPHDAAARSRRVLRANERAITVAEVLTGVVQRAVEVGSPTIPFAEVRGGWGALEERPFPWTEADVARATDTLRTLTRRFGASGPNDGLEFDWPERLILPVPAERRRTRPGPRRR
jgi:hypothetical protein